MTLSSTELLDDTVPSGEPDYVSGMIARAQEGDNAAFAGIFQAFSRRVLGLCRHMLRDRDLAEDASGEVFLRLRASIQTYDGSAAFERWLLRVTANHCVDLIRRRRREHRWMDQEDFPADPPSTDASPLTLVLVKERRGEIERAIAGLGEDYRLPLVLRYYAELSYEEIAAELGVEKTQVAGRIFRAKHMLRKSLEGKIR
jgi:RNA polymerase sigma-70 factor (ECF subfamily)